MEDRLDLEGKAIANFEAHKLQEATPQKHFHRNEGKESDLCKWSISIVINMMPARVTITLNYWSQALLYLARGDLTIAALLFNLSALSTNPNFAGGRPGELGGCVTPCKQMQDISRKCW